MSRERATGAWSLDDPYNQLLIQTGHADKIGLKLWAMQGIALQHTGTKSWPSNWVRTGPVLVEADAQPA